MAVTDLPDLWVVYDNFCHHHTDKRLDQDCFSLLFNKFSLSFLFLCTDEMTAHSPGKKRQKRSTNGKRMAKVWNNDMSEWIVHILLWEVNLYRKVGIFLTFPAQILSAELTCGFWTCNNPRVSKPVGFVHSVISPAALKGPPGPSPVG